MALISRSHKTRYHDYYASKEVRVKPHRWQSVIEKIACQIGADSVLDYGCGPARALSTFSELNVFDYDPAMDGLDSRKECDLVVCNHVLEHVEPECLADVLKDIKQLARKAAYIALSCELSTKKLPDGTEWHLLVHDPSWWRKTVREVFGEFEELNPPDPKTEFAMLWFR